ncbi:MAG: hypothetical protein ACHQM6_02980 [Candidatus Kapaibacterium sp.]
MITIKSAAIAGFLLMIISCSGEKKPAENPSDNKTLTTATHVNGRSSLYTLSVRADSQAHADKTMRPPDEPQDKPAIKGHPSWRVKSRGSQAGEIDPFREEKDARRKAEAKATKLSHLKKTGVSVNEDKDTAAKNQLWKNKVTALFTVDTAMILDENYDVFLSIYSDPEDSSEANKYEDTRAHSEKSPPARIVDTIRQHTDYRVTLHGNNFQITSVTDSIQHLYPHAVTTWKWQVSPETKDALELTVVIAGFDNEFKIRKDNFFTRRVLIRVTPIQKIRELAGSQYAFAAYTTILAGLGWMLQNRRKKRKAGN